MIPATIATAVAPETIAKVTRLFNNTAFDVVTELFQNARRAGALAVAVIIQTSGPDTIVHVIDDGHGIADPASIVTLGRSGWPEETRRMEDPAGMGVFSLAGRDVIVRSFSRPDRQGWMAHIPATAWETSRPVALSPDPISQGTAITIKVPGEWLKTLEVDVARAAKHFPLPVTLNGDMLPREDWLKDALHIEEWNGTRIGVYQQHPSHYSSRDGRLNFHGLTIPCQLPSVREVDRGGHWIARVDIFDAPHIQLVLPARKEAIENTGLAALRRAVAGAIYRAIAARGAHRLSVADWREARDHGVELPEAAPYLFGWDAPAADSSNNYVTGARFADPGMVIMCDFDALVAQPAAEAIKNHNPFGGPLVVAQDEFKGYAWYDVLARVEDLRFRVVQGELDFVVSETMEAPSEAEDGWVSAITLEATISHAGASIEVSTPAAVAFAPDQWTCNSPEESSIFVVRDSGQTAAAVADLFERAIFCPSADSDADAYETQHERFQRDAAERIIGLLEGDDAALENRIRERLSGHYFLIPPNRTVTVVVTRDGLDIVIAEREVTPDATPERG